MDITPADARTQLGEFGHSPDSIKALDDAGAVKLHGTVIGAAKKYGGASGAYDFGQFKDPEVKTWVESYKGAYPTIESLASKAYNLEKFVGAEKAQRGVIIPKADAKPEEWTKFWRSVGAQEKEDGYKIPDASKEDVGLKTLRAHAHAIGMPVSQWDATVAWYDKASKEAADREVAAFKTASEADMKGLRDTWGAGYDNNLAKAQRAVNVFVPGATKEEKAKNLASMEGALGTKFIMEFFHSIGTKIGEHAFVGPDGVVENKGGMTPEQARAEIETLKKDKDFGKKLVAGDSVSKTKWDELHVIAFGQKAA